MNNEIREIAKETVISIKNLDNIENINKAPELKTIIQNFGTKLIEKTYNVQDFGKGLDILLDTIKTDLPQYANKNNEVNNDMKEVIASSLIDLHLSETYRQEVIAAVTDFARLPKVENQIGNLREKFLSTSNTPENKNKFTN